LAYSRTCHEERVIAMPEPAVVVPPAGPPRLSHDELAVAQKETLNAPRRKYGIAARALFVTLDIVYGKPRTMSKFKVLEIVARVPYQTWEHVA
jgi:ubiquinol oxidase